MNAYSKAAKLLGRKGGLVKSIRKKLAAQANGRKGGSPRKMKRRARLGGQILAGRKD